MTYQSILNQIIADPDYQANIKWGAPRHGHKEGTIEAHIAELMQNLKKLRPKLTPDEFDRLPLLIHTHDTFKPQANSGVPIEHPDSHASLGRAFLARYCQDQDLLIMNQYHDETYALFKQFKHKRSWNQARAKKLIDTIPNWDLFIAFLIIDGCTESKSREPLEWFFDALAPDIQTRWTKADIL